MSAGLTASAVLAACTPKATQPPTEEKLTEKPTETKPEEKPTNIPTETPQPKPTHTPKPTPTPKPKTLLTLNCATYSGFAERVAKNVNDIVTPYIEKRFNVKFNILFIPDANPKQFYALNKAAGTPPDVMLGNRELSLALALSGDFLDLTDYISKIPSYMRWVDKLTWNRYLTNGRQIALNVPVANINDPELKGNIFYEGYNTWPMLIREDILTRLGYKLTPLSDIAKGTTDKGVWPSFDQLAITPAIDTPEAFGEFLKKVKALNIMVGDIPFIPLTACWWDVFVHACMMDNGVWRINDAGEVDGWLGLPGAHDFYKMWSEWYKNDLLDKDYITHKDDQLQEKWNAGRVAAGVYVPNLSAARQALIAKDPTAVIRPVAWPKVDQRYGWNGAWEGGYFSAIFHKEIKEIDRVIELIEWINSDESIDIHVWGPKEAGLYTTDSSGKKLWKDEETRKNIMENVADSKNADYYGVFNPVSGNFTSRVSLGMPMVQVPIKADPRFNYPPKLNIFDVVPRVLGKNVNMLYNLDGHASHGDGGENVNAVSSYYWYKFSVGDIAKLLTSKDDAEYEAGWEEIQNANATEGQYPAAKKDMEKWFAEFGPGT